MFLPRYFQRLDPRHIPHGNGSGLVSPLGELHLLLIRRIKDNQHLLEEHVTEDVGAARDGDSGSAVIVIKTGHSRPGEDQTARVYPELLATNADFDGRRYGITGDDERAAPVVFCRGLEQRVEFVRGLSREIIQRRACIDDHESRCRPVQVGVRVVVRNAVWPQPVVQILTRLAIDTYLRGR